jgi:hypothetical protein
LATPPIDGLHDICAIAFMFIVISKTDDPKLAAAAAASHPACPAPTTIISYFSISLNVPRETLNTIIDF